MAKIQIHAAHPAYNLAAEFIGADRGSTQPVVLVTSELPDLIKHLAQSNLYDFDQLERNFLILGLLDFLIHQLPNRKFLSILEESITLLDKVKIPSSEIICLTQDLINAVKSFSQSPRSWLQIKVFLKRNDDSDLPEYVEIQKNVCQKIEAAQRENRLAAGEVMRQILNKKARGKNLASNNSEDPEGKKQQYFSDEVMALLRLATGTRSADSAVNFQKCETDHPVKVIRSIVEKLENKQSSISMTELLAVLAVQIERQEKKIGVLGYLLHPHQARRNFYAKKLLNKWQEIHVNRRSLNKENDVNQWVETVQKYNAWAQAHLSDLSLSQSLEQDQKFSNAHMCLFNLNKALRKYNPAPLKQSEVQLINSAITDLTKSVAKIRLGAIEAGLISEDSSQGISMRA